MRKIYDCFIFFNELDLLDLRLNTLDPRVDHFVLVEASTTHSGKAKPYYFEENKDRYSKFLDKIIHIKIDDIPDTFNFLPKDYDLNTFDGQCVEKIHRYIGETNLFNKETEPHYGRDFFQKESIIRGMENCCDDDIIIASDVDEIPNPKVLEKIDKFINSHEFFTLDQTTYYYYLNMWKEDKWKGSRIGLYKNLKDYSFNKLRAQANVSVDNGGWHFSFQGGPEKVKQKIQAYSHQEFNNEQVVNNVENNVSTGTDPFGRSQLRKVDIDETFPKYLLDNLEKYQHMIC